MRSKLIATVFAAVFVLAAANRTLESRMQQAIDLMETKGDIAGAMRLFEEVAKGADRGLAARSLLYLGDCRAKLGQQDARRHYERIVREYSEQREIAAEARTRMGAGAAHPAMSARRVWSGPKVDVLGTVSPDGRYLSFVDWETGDLAMRDLVLGQNRRLTNKGSWNENDEFAEESAISRDGKQIAYSWFNKEFRYEIRLANVNGEPDHSRLFDNEEIDWVAPHDWSPDGKWIAVQITRKDNTGQIGVISTANGALRVLKSVDWRGPTKMYFSSDGHYLAYDLPPHETSDQRDIFLLALDGSREIKAVEHPANDVLLGWCPNGGCLLFGSDRSGSYGLWAVKVAEGKTQGPPEFLKPDIGQPWSMGITRSGAMVYSVNSSVRDLQLAKMDLQTGKLTSTPMRPVQTYVGSNGFPGFSPDGKYLSYVSRRDQASRVIVLGVKSLITGETREHRLPLSGFYVPRWAADSRSVVAQGRDRKGRLGIYGVNIESGETSPLVLSEPGGYVNSVGFSSDNRKLYYRRQDPSTREDVVLERDLDSGRDREVTRGRHLFTGFVSPDGRYLSYRAPDREEKASVLWVIPVAGGAAREVLRVKEPEFVNPGPFLGDSVLVRKVLDSGNQAAEFWLAPLHGGQARKLDLEVTNARNLQIHPDGRQVVFEAGENRGEVWVLENFLPARQEGR
jgi:Tol biopolymer transport system component